MDTRKLSSFIIAVGVILIALGGGNWAKVENDAKSANEFRLAMLRAENDRIDNLPYSEKYEARARLLEKIGREVDMLSRGYVWTARKDHTLSYALMAGGLLVLIIGVGMRVSSKKPDEENASQ